MRNNAGAKRGRWRATIASGGEDVGYVTLKVVDKDGSNISAWLFQPC